MPTLGVNIDHVATLREARKIREPDPLEAARLCKSAGAHGITVHLREDRRHIQERDVLELLRLDFLPVNLEMAATASMCRFALKTGPRMVTLVPEKREELTTEGGLDAAARAGEITPLVRDLAAGNLGVSLFIEPDEKQIAAALETGADTVEFHTGAYANAHDAGDEVKWKAELARLNKATVSARKQGLIVNMGHGLNYRNTRPVALIEGVHEFNIGHSIVGRALMMGFEQAVKEMLALVR